MNETEENNKKKCKKQINKQIKGGRQKETKTTV
jgi:hypothetical protein